MSNYNSTVKERAYGEKLSSLTGGSHYVIDTGRNGKGSNGEWCNPTGRALGVAPTVVTDAGHLDAELWVKPRARATARATVDPPPEHGGRNSALRAGRQCRRGSRAL